MQAGVGLLVTDVMPIYMIMPRYSHKYSLFYQLLDSNLFTHHLLFFSREATSETYGPGSLSHIICLCDLVFLAFIFSSINCTTVICLPTICYFSREMPLVKSTPPGSLLYYICLCDLFSFAFIFRSIKPKIQKYIDALYFIWCLTYQTITTLSRPRANF